MPMGLGVRLGSAQVIIASEPSYTPSEYFTIEAGVITAFSADGIEHDQPAITVVSISPEYGLMAIESIGDGAFSGCTSLISITIGAEVIIGASDNLDFDINYIVSGSQAGTYLLINGKWVLQ